MKNHERTLAPLAAVISAAIIGLCILSLNISKPVESTEFYKSSVMITNLAGNSGGSGTIISSTNEGSIILTNGHVCHVADNGGLVKTLDNQNHSIVEYRLSKLHDLCIILVLGNLHADTKLASAAPKVFDSAVIVGHPQLLPVTVTKGNFSEHVQIPVAIGSRECTDAEKSDKDTALFCAFVGVLPIIKVYDSVLVSATIMPGSSGSPIFNTKGELENVVFAGSGELGYAFTVPYEYVENFLRVESQKVPSFVPNSTQPNKKEDETSLKEKVDKACKLASTNAEKDLCKIFERDLVSLK